MNDTSTLTRCQAQQPTLPEATVQPLDLEFIITPERTEEAEIL